MLPPLRQYSAMSPERPPDHPQIRSRAWLFLVGLPLVGVVVFVVFAVAFADYRALVLVPLGFLISAVNYRRLKA